MNEHIAAETTLKLGSKTYTLTVPTIRDMQSLMIRVRDGVMEEAKRELQGLPPELAKEHWEEAKKKRDGIGLNSLDFYAISPELQLDVILFMFFSAVRKNHPEIKTIEDAGDLVMIDPPAVMDAVTRLNALANGLDPTVPPTK